MFRENPSSYFLKSLICNSLSTTKVRMCVCLMGADIETSRYAMCARLAALPALCQASIPTSHHASLSAFLLSVSVCLSFVFLFLQSAGFIYSFEFPLSHSHKHTLTLETHTLSNTIFTLSRQRQGGT